MRFLNEAQTLTGACRNRMESSGAWVDEPALEDAWGRCLWGLGTAAAHSDVGMVRKMAANQFQRGAQRRSVWPRAMAFAVLGAAELLSAHPGHSVAHSLIADYVAGIPAPTGDPAWPWPEPRLTYANAVLAEAMIAAGVAIEDSALYNRAWTCWHGWSSAKRPAITCRSPLPAAGASMIRGRDSTSSRSRWPHWQMHVPARLLSIRARSGQKPCGPPPPGSRVPTISAS